MELNEVNSKSLNQNKKKAYLNNVSSYYESFTEEGLIPGFREASRSKHITLRIIWVILILFGIALTIYFMVDVVSEYLDEPTATKVKYVRQKSYNFPQIYFCLHNWINEENLREMKLSKNGSDYLYSLAYVKNFETKAEYETAKNEFEKFASNNNLKTYEEAFNIGSWTSEDLLFFGSTTSKGIVNITKLYSIGLEQVCYNVSFPLQSASVLAKTDNFFSFLLSPFTSAERNLLLVGKDVRFIDKSELFKIIPGHNYNVQVNAHSVKSLDRKDSPCMEQDDVNRLNYNQNECVQRCTSNMFVQEGLICNLMVDADTIFSTSRKQDVCSSFHAWKFRKVNQNESIEGSMDNLDEIFEKVVESCESQCKQACENVFYSVTLIDDTEEVFSNTTTLSFTLTYAADGMMVLEELSTYSFQSAVSNIGGQLGLWMGLSIFTIFQTISFFVNNCFKNNPQQ